MKKIKRKKKLISKGFQFRVSLSAVFISLLSFSIIVSFILVISGSYKSGDILNTASKLDRAVKAQDTIMESFAEYSKRVKDPIFILATDKIGADHAKSIGVIKRNIGLLKVYSERNREFLTVTAGVMTLNIVFLFLVLVRLTNRAAGPVSVMHGYVRDMLEGRKPDLRDLRKKDAFKEFHEDFVKLIEKIDKKRERLNGSKTGKKKLKSNKKESGEAGK